MLTQSANIKTTQHVLIHTCYLQGLRKRKATHGQPESPLHRTRRHITNTFHWGTAKSLKAWMKWNQHVGLRVPQRHANGPTHRSHNHFPFLLLKAAAVFLNWGLSWMQQTRVVFVAFRVLGWIYLNRLHIMGQQSQQFRSREKYSATCTHINQEKQK